MYRLIALLLTGIALNSAAVSAEQVLKTEKLAGNVYALIGPTTNRDPQNLGNNANFGVVIGDKGVLLIDTGATYKGAQMIHAAIREITDKPVTRVINTGGQDHRWLGNGYFKALGAEITANENAVTDQKARTQDQLFGLGNLVGDAGLEGTEPVYADEVFGDSTIIDHDGIRVEIHHAGHAHTPGDSFVWLPEHRIMFAGDIVYTDRMLGIGGQSAHRSWIGAFKAMAAHMPEIVVGGHGRPAPLAKATADSYDYLVFLRQAVQTFMDEGRGIEEVGSIDQSRFGHLANFDTLSGRNAQRVYEELEWE